MNSPFGASSPLRGSSEDRFLSDLVNNVDDVSDNDEEFDQDSEGLGKSTDSKLSIGSVGKPSFRPPTPPNMVNPVRIIKRTNAKVSRCNTPEFYTHMELDNSTDSDAASLHSGHGNRDILNEKIVTEDEGFSNSPSVIGQSPNTARRPKAYSSPPKIMKTALNFKHLDHISCSSDSPSPVPFYSTTGEKLKNENFHLRHASHFFLPACFHGPISREEADSKLKKAGSIEKSYLVREKIPSRLYVLSFVCRGNILHFQLERHHPEKKEISFDNLDDQTNSQLIFSINGNRKLGVPCHTIDEVVDEINRKESGLLMRPLYP